MKSIYRFAAILFMACTIVACGSSKSTTKQDKVELKDDKCIELAQKKPDTRQWGHGTGFTISESIAQAELDARGKFTQSIEAIVEAITQDGSEIITKASKASGLGASSVADRQAAFQRSVTQYAKNAIKNTVSIENSRFQLKDGTYECYVCMEYRDGIEKMAADVTNQLYELMTEEEKEAVKQNLEDFRQSVRSSLGKNK